MKNASSMKIVILGAAGRMGQTLIRCARQCDDISISSAVESEQNPLLGKDAGSIAGIASIGVSLTADARRAAQAADVLIDFSFPSAVEKHALLAAQLKKPMVIGSTGLSDTARANIQKAAEQTPIIWSPNMSLGVNLLFMLAALIAKQLAAYDVEIIETHHRHKKDAPSGTALRLAETVAAAREVSLNTVVSYGRQGMEDARPLGQIGVHSVRAGDVVGDHTIVFATNGERLELTHRASSRECFAVGALRAAKWVMGRKPGLYTMQHVLGIDV